MVPPDARTLGGFGPQAALAALANSRFLADTSERLLIHWLRQVRTYFTDAEIRRQIQARFAEAITSDTRVVVAHSLGSVVAYEALAAHPNWNVPTLVTLGSPLGIRNIILDRLHPAPEQTAAGGVRGRWPGSVTRWTNIADRRDFVALVKKLHEVFDPRTRRYRDRQRCADAPGRALPDRRADRRRDRPRPASGPAALMSGHDRWFIGAATATYTDEFKAARLGEDDRPELAAEVERMRGLFERLGYRTADGFGVDLPRDTFTDRLRAFLIHPDRTENDTVVIYYTGHGVLDRGELLLPMSNTTDDYAYTSLPAGDLTERLLSRGVKVRRLLFILDTCYAGAALARTGGGAIDFLAQMRAPTTEPTVGLITAARPTEQAGTGAFTQAFVDAVENDRAASGHEPEFIALDSLVGAIKEKVPPWQHARCLAVGDGTAPFLPNPRLDRWLRDLDLRTQKQLRLRAERDSDLRDHVLPHARGLDTAGPDRWLYTGRHAALAHACRWLESGTPATLVVTGDPGSGKSALLSRLTVLADPTGATASRTSTPPERHTPPSRVDRRFIHARGLTPEQLMASLCEATGAEPTTSPGQLLAQCASTAATGSSSWWTLSTRPSPILPANSTAALSSSTKCWHR